MLEEKKKEIGGTIYTFHTMPASVALDVLMDLVKMLGPGLSPILSNLGSLQGFLGKDVDDAKTDFLGHSVTLLCSGLDKEKTKAIISQLGKHTMIEGKGALTSSLFESHFAGKMGEMIQWIGAALGAQYGDFFDVLGSAMAAAPQVQDKAKVSKSRTT
jgi:hypothetical protein